LITFDAPAVTEETATLEAVETPNQNVDQLKKDLTADRKPG